MADGNNDVALVQEINAQHKFYTQELKAAYITLADDRYGSFATRLDDIINRLDRIETALATFPTSQADRAAATAATKQLDTDTQALASALPKG